MNSVQFLSIADQAAAHLRNEILRGRWASELPGKHQLAEELGINSKTVEAALRQLEASGLVVSQGVGRRKRVNLPERRDTTALRIGVLLNDETFALSDPCYLRMHHQIYAAGHSLLVAPKSMTALRFEIDRVAAMVESINVDAWLIIAGSHPILSWFASRPGAAFAYCGQRRNLRIAGAGPNIESAITQSVAKLTALGHRRIVFLCRRIHRLPAPGRSVTAFAKAMQSSGFPCNDFNLPDWDDKPTFHHCLENLFRVTPPTALIIDECSYYVAALHFICRLGLRVPREVSLICTENSTELVQCDPPVSSYVMDLQSVLSRLVQWTDNISRGQPDYEGLDTTGDFIPGGTIGPAPK